MTGLPAWKRGQPGQVGNEAAPTVATSAGVRLVTFTFHQFAMPGSLPTGFASNMGQSLVSHQRNLIPWLTYCLVRIYGPDCQVLCSFLILLQSRLQAHHERQLHEYPGSWLGDSSEFQLTTIRH